MRLFLGGGGISGHERVKIVVHRLGQSLAVVGRELLPKGIKRREMLLVILNEPRLKSGGFACLRLLIQPSLSLGNFFSGL